MKSPISLKFLSVIALGALAVLTNVPAIAAMLPSDGGVSILAAGMLVNKENLTNLFISLKTTFNNAFAAAPSVWEKIAMKVPSTTGQNDYSWLSNFPRMRKWIGEKTIKALEGFKYTVVNDDFEATVEVDRNHIEDDNLGIYGPQAQGAGDSAKQLPDEIVFELINNGFTSKCYDGQFFFDTDHPVRQKDGTVVSASNKGTKVFSIATLAAAKTSYGAARTAMKKFKDDEGRPLNIKPGVLLVGPALEDDANLLMTVDRLEDGKPNPYKGTATVVCDARIDSDTFWALLDTSKPVKPFIYQERKAPVFVSQTDMNADDVFNRRKYKFGAEARAAGGYGFWQLAWASDGTVA
jgi:phage major head subunit gpT-like protein